MVKRAVRKLLDRTGLDVRRPGPGQVHIARRRPDEAGLDRATLAGSLRNMALSGFAPGVVIDVGAAYGTRALWEVFPDAHHLMVEPLDEFSEQLHSLAGRLTSAEVFVGLAGPERGKATLNVHPDLVGSSMFREDEQSDVNGVERIVPMAPLSELVGDRPGPILLKVDTQGAELEVLRGAEGAVLDATEVAVLEVSFMQFFAGGPLAAEVIAYMDERGFAVHDIADLQYRPLDLALSQVDMVFVRRESPLRARTAYATAEQRARQTKELDRANRPR